MSAGRLMVVCGAGLSMAPPSNLPSAKAVAEYCFDKYQLEIDPHCTTTLRDDLEALAEHFAATNTLQSIFIDSLVPWDFFSCPPNPGHAAIADFLITGAAAAGISSNYDILIERWAWENGADFRGALDGDEANVDSARRSPLLKFHGCAQRDRASTVWAASQLESPVISSRIQRSKTWMAANLRQKDLLVIGFWSDWEYLNAVISDALVDVCPLSVTVVDLSSLEALEEKAPGLWNIAHAQNVFFEHIQESGADVLDQLRRAFSTNYLRQILVAGRAAFEQNTNSQCDPSWFDIADFDSETLYGLRRDAEGVPARKPATRVSPANVEVLGYFHLLLRQAGAIQIPDGYEFGGRSIRVINGAGAVLSSLRSKFVQPPVAMTTDMFVAVGATDLGLPGNVVRGGKVGDFIRPATDGEWFDLNDARAELNV